MWYITILSESGDDYGPVFFDKKPPDRFIKKYCMMHFPDEFGDGDGPGAWASYLHIDGPYPVVFVKVK